MGAEMRVTHLTSSSLAHEPSSLPFCSSIRTKTKSLDMRMCEGTIVAGVALDLTDLDHGVVGCGQVAATGLIER